MQGIGIAHQIFVMKILGIDYGLERTGLAATDETALLAYPLATFRLGDYQNRKAFLAALAERIMAEEARLVVIGLPLLPDGTESMTARQVRNFAQRIRRRINCPCVFFNEYLTSEEAFRDLRDAGVRSGRLKSVLDQQAAVRILEHYINAPSRAQPLDEGA